MEYGGFFWREDGADDYVLCVRVTPCSDAGGPNNQFWIEQGSIYMPNDADKRSRALSVCGWENEPAPTRWQLVDAFMAYSGLQRDSMNGETVLQIGAKADEPRHGLKVDTDFAGLNVWARTTTGQAIHADGVIERIYADMVRA